MADMDAIAQAVARDDSRIKLSIPTSLAWALLVAVQDLARSGDLGEPLNGDLVSFGWELQGQIELRHPGSEELLNAGWNYEYETALDPRS